MRIPRPRRIVFLVYPGFEFLDLAGPLAVFSSANLLAGATLYRTVIASSTGDRISSGAGTSVDSVPCGSLRFGARDSVLVMGAQVPKLLRAAMRDACLRLTLQKAARRAERHGSVCTGAFVLGTAGLLHGRAVATHWAAGTQLQQLVPSAEVVPDGLYVIDDTLWTSAGVATGLDMALAMLERDHGARLMAQVARHLVVYARRPGHQSQFSSLVEAQAAGDGRFADLVDWIESRLALGLTIEAMAQQVGMSVRSFHRNFTREIGQTPARYLDLRRMERARSLLESGQSVKRVALEIGFASESAFRSAFAARFGIPPSHHARMHRR